MPDAETEVVQTRFGETEVELYECDSCGVRVKYDDTVPFTIGDREGRACESCESEGPISTPKKVVGALDKHVDVPGALMALFFAPILLPVGMLIWLDEGGDVERGIAIATVACLIWLGIPLVLALMAL